MSGTVRILCLIIATLIAIITAMVTAILWKKDGNSLLGAALLGFTVFIGTLGTATGVMSQL